MFITMIKYNCENNKYHSNNCQLKSESSCNTISLKHCMSLLVDLKFIIISL